MCRIEQGDGRSQLRPFSHDREFAGVIQQILGFIAVICWAAWPTKFTRRAVITLVLLSALGVG